MSNIGPLKLQIPSQGWRQFLTARKNMLDAYDRAKEQGKIRGIQTLHGNVGEAMFREWLSDFFA